MRKLKVGLSALSFIAGGIMVASSATPKTHTGSTADVNISFGDTNGAQQIYFVGGLPTASSNANQTIDVGVNIVETDGAGKIEGVAYLTITYGGDTNSGSANFIVDVTGSITSKGNPSVATVSMNLKGNGYSTDGNGLVNQASLSLKFTGTPNSDGVIAGKLNGSVKLGTKLITGNTTDPVKDAPAVITESGSAPFNINVRIVEIDTKFWAAGSMVGSGTNPQDGEIPVSGSGTIKNTSYSASLKGIGFGKGSSAKITGTTAVATNGFITVGTNDPVPVLITIPGTAKATGKVVGQKLDAGNGTGTVTVLE
jgi:hypothetical protein